MPKTAKPELVRITEEATRPQSVDAAAGVIRGVKLLGFESKNGRLYPPKVVRSSVHLYEGAKVNINHPASGDPAQPRQYEDRIGVIRLARIVEGHSGGIYGDFHYNPKHRIAEQLAWDAEHNPEAVRIENNKDTLAAPCDLIKLAQRTQGTAPAPHARNGNRRETFLIPLERLLFALGD